MHPWMSGYVHVLEHPFFAVTGEDGTFTIKGLPPGEYELTVLHESSIMEPTPATATVTGTATPMTVAPEDERLRQARQAEQDERYGEAIKLYREYVDANPKAADAVTISTHVSELKDFAGRLQMARVWMDQKDFAEARKDYAAALKLRPDSKVAREGLARADARLTRSP
jgi:thioredoxin-like negative regulator of GroEL